MGTQTHTRSNNKGRKVSQKKKLLTGGSDGYTEPEPNTSQEELNESGEITQSGGAYANITKYKRYNRNTRTNHPQSMMITFKYDTNLNTIKNGIHFFSISSTILGPNDTHPLNTAYILGQPNFVRNHIYDTSPTGANQQLASDNGFRIPGTSNNSNHNLSACLTTDLILPEILNKVDNIYLANQANDDYENADYETTQQPDQENRYNVIILPFTVLKQNARQAVPPALPNIVDDKVCVYLLSHYIGTGTISMHNLINNNNHGTHNIEDNKFFHTDPTNAPPNPHIAWRPFFCNYNHHTRILNGFIDQADPVAAPANNPGACTGIIRTRKCDETIPVAKNILYHILESTCNPNKTSTSGNSIPSYVAAAVANVVAVPAAGTYKQKCNAISDIVNPMGLDANINANTFINKIKKVVAAGERDTTTVDPHNPPYARAISIETYTIPDCGAYKDLNSSEATVPGTAGNQSKLFPKDKKVMVISFMVEVDPTNNLANEFPIVEYATTGEYLFNNQQNRPRDGQVAWVPIAEMVTPGAPAGAAVAPPGHTTCVKLNSSTAMGNHVLHGDGGAAGAHVCTPHAAPAPLGGHNSCMGMETPYEWFLHLVNSNGPAAAATDGQKLPKILKDNDGFKIQLTTPPVANASAHAP